MEPLVVRIVSGGQTGADRGGLDAAIELGIDHGGWCPEGRKAEDGRIPGRYVQKELPGGDYIDRTERNVVDSDVTAVFTYGPPEGGSFETGRFADIYARPWLHLDMNQGDEECAGQLLVWLQGLDRPNLVLNVAGSRASKAPDLRRRVRRILVSALW
jgi:hypothetical protein